MKKNPPAKKKRNKDRAPDQTTMTLSLSSDLKARIGEAAKADRRSMSNWMAKRLGEWLDEEETKRRAGGPAKNG